MAYKRYIEGIYYQDSKLRETLNSGMQSTLDALRNGYPYGWTFNELAEANKLKKNSTYQNCRALHRDNIVKGEVERPQKYYFEDYNYNNNKKERFKFPFAPGYVQYTEDFLDNYETLNEKQENEINQIYPLLINILGHAVRNKKQTHQHCKFCGYDHEIRDFMRATLLHLIDKLETNIHFIEFMQREEIINDTTYEQLISECRRTTSKTNEQKETAQKKLMKEQQFTLSMENEEQTARHKQQKRRPHTEEWKRQMSLQMKMKNYSHSQEDIEKMRKYPIDDHAFDKLKDDAKYWIGYIMARGSIVKRSHVPKSPSIKISVLKEDRNHLDRFKEFIKSKLPVTPHEKKHVYELEFRSRRIVSELEKYGIRHKMRYHEKVILLELDKDFWRGFIDGNAIFDISRYDKISLRIKKGHELILQFKIFSENILRRSIGEPKLEVKNWSLTITDGNAVELYGKLLYDKNCIALDGNLERMKQVSSL